MKKKFSKILASLMALVMIAASIPAMAFAAETANTWKTMAPMSQPRGAFKSVVLNGKIYAFGGRNDKIFLNSVEEYDPKLNTWVLKSPMPTKRDNLQLEVIDGKVYAIGGHNGETAMNSVEKYDPVTDTWTKEAPMINRRELFQTAVIDGKIYVFGYKNLEVYDPIKNVWEKKADMNVNRGRFQAQVVNGKIYVFGGQYGVPFNSLEVYDPATNVWTMKASMKYSRTNFQSVAIDGKIYALGGGDNTVEEYDPETDIWTVKASMADSRSFFEALVINKEIYVAGGTNLSSVEKYNPNTDTWTKEPSMSTVRQYFRMEFVEGSIFTIGGNRGSYIDSTESLKLQADNPTLTVTASPKTVSVGGEFTTTLAVHNGTNLCAEDIKVNYDPDLFEYKGVAAKDGQKVYKEDTSTPGSVRFIIGCLGKNNAATGDKDLITLNFKARKKGTGKVDIVKGRIADNDTLEEDVLDENCGEDTITVEGTTDVNRSGSFTLLDLGIDSWYYGVKASDTDSTRFDADVVTDGVIDENDLTSITKSILGNAGYNPNQW